MDLTGMMDATKQQHLQPGQVCVCAGVAQQAGTVNNCGTRVFGRGAAWRVGLGRSSTVYPAVGGLMQPACSQHSSSMFQHRMADLYGGHCVGVQASSDVLAGFPAVTAWRGSLVLEQCPCNGRSSIAVSACVCVLASPAVAVSAAVVALPPCRSSVSCTSCCGVSATATPMASCTGTSKHPTC